MLINGSKRRVLLPCLLFLCLSCGPARAAFLPYGVHNNVLLSDVTGSWGWSQIYRGDYGADNIAIADMFAGHGDYVMLGGIADGSATIDVLAAVSWDEFTTYTPRHVTHAANGAEWYNNNGSLGFAGPGDAIIQNPADANGLAERDRLSWHTYDSDTAFLSLASIVRSGWRSGSNLSLNSSTSWDRIIFTANISEVPVPAALWLFASAIIGLAGFSRGRKPLRLQS